MSEIQTIVIGGGHNGLIAATKLAKSGRKVVLLEGRDQLGGLAGACEFHPGYRTGGYLFDTGGLRDEVVRELELERHGLVRRPGTHEVFVPDSQQGLWLSRELEATVAEVERLCPGDGTRYRDFQAFLTRVAPIVRNLLVDLPGRVQDLGSTDLWELAKKGMGLRRLGKHDMLELLRIALMCSADWLNEYFRGDLVKAALAFPAHLASFTGPWSPGTTINLLLARCDSGKGVVGGPAALIAALTRAAQAAGVEIRTSAKVARIELAQNRVSGIALANGERLETANVFAACHPTHVFFDLIDPNLLPFALEESIRQYRTRGTTAIVNLALRAPLRLRCRPEANPARVRIVANLDQMERAFDPVKYKQMSSEPLLEIYRPTVEDASCAPKGGDVLSILVHFAPYDLEGGWNEAARQQLLRATLAQLSPHAPELADQIVASQVLTPLDLEREYGLSGGHLLQGEQAIDQMLVRPALVCTDYTTPIEGLLLCGGGTRPGGTIDGLAGLRAPARLKH